MTGYGAMRISQILWHPIVYLSRRRFREEYLSRLTRHSRRARTRRKEAPAKR